MDYSTISKDKSVISDLKQYSAEWNIASQKSYIGITKNPYNELKEVTPRNINDLL